MGSRPTSNTLTPTHARRRKVNVNDALKRLNRTKSASLTRPSYPAKFGRVRIITGIGWKPQCCWGVSNLTSSRFP